MKNPAYEQIEARKVVELNIVVDGRGRLILWNCRYSYFRISFIIVRIGRSG